MPILRIDDDNGKELLRVTIRAVDPSAATVAILDALRELPEPKRQRSDKGKRREPKLLPAATGEPIIT